MSDPGRPLRRAGRLDAVGGETLLWSVAEGRRGRRWRSIRLAPGGHVLSHLLLEVDPGGRWTRLELASPAGLLTLHPAPDGRSVHGNVVTPDGMRHLSVAWGSEHRLAVEGEPVLAAAFHDAARAGPGPGIVVGPDLALVERQDVVVLGRAGSALPGPSWPLEIDDPE